MITYGGQEIPRSPFEVNVGPYKESTIRAYGPGLSGGVVGYPALFTVETNGETGALGWHNFFCLDYNPAIKQGKRCNEIIFIFFFFLVFIFLTFSRI